MEELADSTGLVDNSELSDDAYLDGLRNYRQKRRSDTISAVREAITRLKTDGKEINFNAVAHESHITRKTLYAVDEVRVMILQERGEVAKREVETSSDPDMQRARIVKLENKLNALKSGLRAIRAELLRDF